MDAELVGWARAAKARSAKARPVEAGRVKPLATLWLFSDAVRAPDALAAARQLTPGISGIVLRHGDAALALALARLCRRRRVALVLAARTGNVPGYLEVGRHLRAAGPGAPGRLPRGALLTASAHNPAELLVARRRGADIVFLSPSFATASHPGAAALGPVRWNRLAGKTGAAALGGITGLSIKRLGRRAIAAGAIEALSLARR